MPLLFLLTPHGIYWSMYALSRLATAMLAPLSRDPSPHPPPADIGPSRPPRPPGSPLVPGAVQFVALPTSDELMATVRAFPPSCREHRTCCGSCRVCTTWRDWDDARRNLRRHYGIAWDAWSGCFRGVAPDGRYMGR